MIWIIFRLTLSELMGRRRLALVVLLALLPALVALAYRLGNQHDDPPQWTADTLLDGVIVTILLPLTALIFGTSALGSEIEDGTIIHLLSKPIPRIEIVVAKLGAASLLTALCVVPSAALSGFIAISGSSEQGIVTGFLIGTLLGTVAYSALFVLLSAMTNRALFIGLAYVFVWEGIVTQLFSGTRYLSVHQCCLGVAGLFSTASEKTFSPDLGGTEALIILAITVVGSVVLAVRSLNSFQVGQSS
ncbi:MAG: ABC transporter permease subunit [Chloroflexota bacterium]